MRALVSVCCLATSVWPQTMTGRTIFRFLLAVSLSRSASLSARPNVLFIIVDDLGARVGGAYAQPGLTPTTPNILRLQEEGVSFTRAYARVTLCSPSRTALLTGLRPEESRLWTIGPYWRSTTSKAASGEYVTLPQALKLSGYNTTGAGKVWHTGTSSGGLPNWGGGEVGGDDMPWSWSYEIPQGVDPRLLFWECDAWTNSTGQSSRSAGVPNGQGCVTSVACVQCLQKYNATDIVSWVSSPCADTCYVDPMIAEYAAGILAQKAASPPPPPQQQQPFAFFTGFKRPHLGFQVPQRFLDRYPVDVPIAAVRAPPDGFPPVAWSANSEIRTYARRHDPQYGAGDIQRTAPAAHTGTMTCRRA